MAVTTEIPWGDGSGDKIYLTRNASEGDQNVQVSSDANTGAARSKVVTFTSGVGNIQRQLTINQAAGIAPVFYDRLIFDGTAYIDTLIIAPENASFRVKLGNETLKATQRCFIMPATTGTIGMHYATNTTSTYRYFNAYYGKSSAAWGGQGTAFSTTSYRFWLTPKVVGWGASNSHSYTKGTGTPSGPIILGSNTSHSGQAYTGSMETFRVYGSDAQNVSSDAGFDNYTPVFTLRPCTYNGEAGMWCVETSTFYGNTAGAGTLTVANN